MASDSLHKYNSSDISFAEPPRASKRIFTLKSSVSDSHARTVAEINAPDEPKEANNVLVYFIAVSICLGAVAYGYDTGFFGGTIALPAFMDAFGIGPNDKTKAERDNISANLVSLFQGGSFFGAALQLPITQTLGRKWSIVLSNIIFIASAFVQAFSDGNVGIMMGGRFMGGFAIGISSLVIPVYLSEFAPPSIRGLLIGMYDVGIQVGTLCGFWINYGLQKNMAPSKFQWQLPVLIQLCPAAILGLAMFFIPETPRFRIVQGRYEEAEMILSRIRKLPRDHPYLQWELAQTRAQVEAENLVRGNDKPIQLVKQLFQSKGHRYRLVLGLGLLFFKTFSGVQAVNYFSPRIFEQLGFRGTQNSLFATGIYGTVKVVCTFIFSFFIVDRVGRRRPLMFGSIVGSLCLFFLGGYLLGVGPRDGSAGERTVGDYFAITAIFLYAAIYCFGYNSVPLTLISEIFTMRFKTLSMTFCLMWQWTCTFAVVRIMPVALTNIGPKTYFIFGSIFSSSTVFVYFCIPETKGLPLEAMDNLFGMVERTDAEKAVLGYEDDKKAEETASHVENATSVGARGRERTNEVAVMGTISERQT